MIKYSLFNKSIFIDSSNFTYSFNEKDLREDDTLKNCLNEEKILSIFKPKCYSFGIDISDKCNLICSYCFNKNMTGRIISFEKAKGFLDKMFSTFPNGEKYFVDLSEKGEPLMNLPVILKIARYCQDKSNELNVEVLPTFVCNGTLLSPIVAEILQKNGILFGVSLDGDKETHDLYRKNKNGQGTYDEIIHNVLGIKNRDYIGCTGTLTNQVFNLKNSILSLSKIFKTVCFRPVRGKEYGFTTDSEKAWEKEYDKLALYLVECINNNEPKIFYCLMNGEDFFGRYLNKAFGGFRTMNRCDASISRFSCDLDGNIYPCSAATCDSIFILKERLKQVFKENLIAQVNRCLDCPFKKMCGGECLIEVAYNHGINPIMCQFKRHLILLATYLELTCWNKNPDLYSKLQAFSIEKQRRYQKDPNLYQFLSNHPELNFVEGKKQFDNEVKRY